MLKKARFRPYCGAQTEAGKRPSFKSTNMFYSAITDSKHPTVKNFWAAPT